MREVGEDNLGAAAQDEEFRAVRIGGQPFTGDRISGAYPRLPHYGFDFQSNWKLGCGRCAPEAGGCGTGGCGMSDSTFALSGRADQADDPPRHSEKRWQCPAIRLPFARRRCRCLMAGTGGCRYLPRCLVPEDRLKVNRPRADDTTNAVSNPPGFRSARRGWRQPRAQPMPR